MKTRLSALLGLFALLGLAYVGFFTDWFAPAPIEIASQVRFSLQKPDFGRSVRKTNVNVRLPDAGRVVLSNLLEVMRTNALDGTQTTHIVRVRTNAPGAPKVPPRVRSVNPNSKLSYQAGGDVAAVTFSLDAPYRITRIRVEDIPADGSAPKLMWHVKGKSLPTTSFVYGREIEGLKSFVAGVTPEPLKAGVPYRLVLEAGRRRGTNEFTTGLAPNLR